MTQNQWKLLSEGSFFCDLSFFTRFSWIFTLFLFFGSGRCVSSAFSQPRCACRALEFLRFAKMRHSRIYCKNHYENNFFKVASFLRVLQKSELLSSFSFALHRKKHDFSSSAALVLGTRILMDFQCFWAPFSLPNRSRNCSGRYPKQHKFLEPDFYGI